MMYLLTKFMDYCGLVDIKKFMDYCGPVDTKSLVQWPTGFLALAVGAPTGRLPLLWSGWYMCCVGFWAVGAESGSGGTDRLFF
jgi:hypothetical protein